MKKFLEFWGILCIIAAIIELCMIFNEESSSSPKLSFWGKMCLFVQMFPWYAFFAFLAAIAFTIVDRILTNFSRSYLYGVLW